MKFSPAIALMMLASTASATDVRWYQIDVLVFRQQSEPSKFAELYPIEYDETIDRFFSQPATPSAPIMVDDSVQSLAQPLRMPFTGEQLVEQTINGYQPVARTLVPQSDRQLQFAVDQFARQSRYTTLGFWSWYEPMVEGQSNEFPVAINTESERGTWSLSGELSLRLSRFIHIDTQLALSQSVEVIEQNNLSGQTAEERMQALQSAPVSRTGTEVMSIDQAVRMRSNELHYIDHPEFGVLLRAQPIEVSQP